MKIGVGLPSTIPGAKADLVLEWARRADAGPFSSLAVLDRLVYTNYESLITLAAVAGVTHRARLVTSVLLAPLRNPAMLAKMGATLDVLSGGRLTLGLGIGGREDDYLAAAVDLKRRGRIFEWQLDLMKRVWAGEPVGDGVGPIGPKPVQPGGPEVLIGAYAPEAIKRIGRWGAGFISGGMADPEQVRQRFQVAEEAWKAAGRPGRPRFVACIYYGLGPQAKERASVYLRDYYGPQGTTFIAITDTPEKIKQALEGFAGIGADELICWPCMAEHDQLDRLAEVVGQHPRVSVPA